MLVEAPGARPRLFNRVQEPKRVKNRLHLDLLTDDVNAEVRRLVALGAQQLAEVEDWVVMADPEGNEFDAMPAVLGERPTGSGTSVRRIVLWQT